MKLGNSRRSSNVEDRRAGGPRVGKGGIGIGAIVLALVAMYFGVDPNIVLDLAQQQQGAPQQAPSQSVPADDPQGQFVTRVLGETEDTWQAVFAQQTNGRYQEPTLVLFRGATPTACGTGQSAMGPFYCPADRKVYIDLGFFREMETQMNAPGDFARAYVIAHEVGHHVQNLLGTLGRVNQQRSQVSATQANQLSVKLELQADCYAGIWAHHADAARGILEPGDIEEGIAAASAVGDDTLQRKHQGTVVPDSFTHGSSAQRVAWFKRGYSSGQVAQCDTFAAGS
ncbi:YpfJ protein, zinc metalloprotease superfamily [plant metagenome]|uniref:YpfJ protein, zinc metalloprotease superfamily n=1 Tax=plant metagenome TaxID=1297885 RepID=A0A484SGC5_9ZZZZ